MGEHHEADLKEIKCLRNQALQILKSISYVRQFPTQPLCLSRKVSWVEVKNQSETDRVFSSWPQSTVFFKQGPLNQSFVRVSRPEVQPSSRMLHPLVAKPFTVCLRCTLVCTIGRILLEGYGFFNYYPNF